MSAKVISLKNVRTMNECRRLFAGYSARVNAFNYTEMVQEMDRFLREYELYPNHFLTLVKGEMLLSVAIKLSASEQEKNKAERLLRKLKHEINLKLEAENS